MLRTLKRLFRSEPFTQPASSAVRKGVSAAAATPKSTKRTIAPDRPRFPPSHREHPVIDPASLLSDQRELISPLKDVLGLSPENFARYVEPVLLRYAAYVQLLPASHVHHHRGAGGLLRHGLEVAYHSGIQARGVTFRFDGPLRQKHEHKTQWRLIYTLAGLLHDIGKPISDMRVVSVSGNDVWEPFRKPLWDWSQENGIDRYVVHWLAGRQHRQHEKLGFVVANKIIGDEVLAYISTIDRAMLPTLMNVLGGQAKPDDPLQKAVTVADRHSVSTDLKQNRIEIDGMEQHVSLDQRLLEIMRELTRTGDWKANGKDGTVWVIDTSGSAYIDWEVAVGDIVRMTNSLAIPGMPRDPHALADILLERGIAEPGKRTVDGVVQVERYHVLKVQGNEVLTLKISDARYIFVNTLPLPPQTVASAPYSAEQQASSSGSEDEETPVVAVAPASDADAQALLETIAAQVATDKQEGTTPPKKPIVIIPPIEELIEQLVEEEGDPPPLHEEDFSQEGHENQAGNSSTEKITDKYAPAQAEATALHASDPQASVDPGPSKRALLEAALETLGEGASQLVSIINAVLDGKEPLGQRLILTGTKAVLRYPFSLQSAERPVLEAVAQLGATGALLADPVMPGKYVTKQNGQSVLILNNTLSALIRAAVEETEQLEDPFAAFKDSSNAHTDKPTFVPTLLAEAPTEAVPVEPPSQKTSSLSEQSGQSEQTFLMAQDPPPEKEAPKSVVVDIVHTPVKERVDLKSAGLGVKELTPTEVVQRVKQMILEGAGPWLAGPVQREGNVVSVEYESTCNLFIAHHPNFSRSRFRSAFVTVPVSGIKVRSGRIFVTLE